MIKHKLGQIILISNQNKGRNVSIPLYPLFFNIPFEMHYMIPSETFILYHYDECYKPL